ncbi:unnamed protein product [Plutella xylostella]|uniref:(diamondback moth) hypothetical protein n=1 Tax=Plutella xylostella TaxID=51655 RepID=A0A8S4DTL8_PLUXY|nr:unnamed protein product [Plutella xylostella]
MINRYKENNTKSKTVRKDFAFSRNRRVLTYNDNVSVSNNEGGGGVHNNTMFLTPYDLYDNESRRFEEDLLVSRKNTNEIVENRTEDEEPFDFDRDINPVITSTELVNATSDIDGNVNKHSYSRDDLICGSPNEINVGICRSNNEILPPVFSTQTSETNLKSAKSYALQFKNSATKDIQWDDMFDTNILPDFNINTLNDDAAVKLECPITCDKTDIKKSKQIKIISKKIITSNIIKKKTNKRKGQLITTEVDPKKVKIKSSDNMKKPAEKLPRKQNYKKTVNSWLDNVTPSNCIEDIVDNQELQSVKENKEPEKTSHTKIQCKDKSETKSPTDKAKKTIQAQLANKDGVMKFKKPNDKTSVPLKNYLTDNTLASNEQASKEKKTKARFVAPIKSQIPVKDVAFNITNIDNNNLPENLFGLEGSEVVLVLVYSNGYCQLNGQHTDDVCKAAGVLMNVNGQFYYLKTDNLDDKTKSKELLLRIITSNMIICYEAKPILMYLSSQCHFIINDYRYKIFDAKIGGFLLDPDSPAENFSSLQKILSYTPEYTIATECHLQKSAWYLELLNDCADKLKSVLTTQSLWNVFTDIEMRLVPIIADMETRGVNVDLKKLKDMESLLLNKLKSVEQECYKVAGKTFQINSTVQVRTILYDELKLDSKSNVKIRETITTGAKSTSETMLRSLMAAHPLPRLILEYRHLHKAHATFLTGISQHVTNGIVKPTWVQTAAATGRIASNNPNLQAIPKAPFSLIMFPETDENDNLQLNFRSVYVARPGFKLVAADFQHIECRVFALAAADTALLAILKQPGDIFRVLAAKCINIQRKTSRLKKTEEEITTEDRERTKRIVYASLYGAGPRKLMDILNIGYDETLSIVASFNRTFPSLKGFGRSVVARCEAEGGRLSTLCGRARLFKHINSADFTLKSQAERQAVNFIVQGSAADLCKMAMVLTEQSLRGSDPPIEGHLVLQIHDELVWEVRDEHVARASEIVKEVMESCGHKCGISMKLPVAISYGQNWGDMKKHIE